MQVIMTNNVQPYQQELGESTFKKPFESPFLVMKWLLRSFQVLGIFNFTIYENFTDFECKPYRIVYYALFTLMFIGLTVVCNYTWLTIVDVDWTTMIKLMFEAFSATDIVAIGVFLVLLQVCHYRNIFPPNHGTSQTT
jgi:hypothetical protein